MKTKPAFLAVLTMAAMTGASLASPATALATSYSPTKIYLNGSDVTNPVHTAAIDPSSGQATSYMPIYYAGQVLAKLGITNIWDGTTWDLTTPSGMSVNTDNPNTSANQMNMSLNGTLVQTAPKVVAVDPASGVQTTFIPIYYLAQVLNRLGVTSTWNGTDWNLTKTTPVTQTVMASDMWQTFAGVSWDIQSHPSIATVGITPSSSTPVTAGDVATYLADWASKAKGVTATWGPNQGKWVPYNLQYEASSDPFTWANINGLFQGTDVSSASSAVTQAEASTILSNLRWWLTGDKVVNGVNYLHVPFYSNYYMWLNSQQLGSQAISNYQSYLADETRYYDEVIAKVQGTTIDLTLPNTASSASNMAWQVIDGQWAYGGWQSKDNRGGKTIQVPGTKDLSIDTATLNPDMYLEGFQIGYVYNNGSIIFAQPYDVGLLQYPNN